MTVFAWRRGRLRRNICEFGKAEADFRSIQQLKAGHQAAERELAIVEQARQAMATATAAK